MNQSINPERYLSPRPIIPNAQDYSFINRISYPPPPMSPINRISYPPPPMSPINSPESIRLR